MRILFCSSEAVPFAKTGGLADVSGALPKALARLGNEVMLTLPKYKQVGFATERRIQLGQKEFLAVGEKPLRDIEGVQVLFIRQDELYLRDSLYGYPDDAERFILFDKAILAFIKELNWKPDVIHCNDWQTGLIPVYLKTTLNSDPFYKGIATVYTIHNLAYQGNFPPETLHIAGLPEELFSFDKLEFWGQFSFMKGGIVFSDIITTVSPRYAEEIQTKELGAGMEGALSYRRERLRGIINGIDYEVWNPKTDAFLPVHYDVDSLEKKVENKKFLQKEVGLAPKDVPLIGLVSRLASQKGFDILLQAMDELFKLDIQMVILGVGEREIEEKLKEKAKIYEDKFKLFVRFDERLSHLIYGGCDIFLMPSLYEPCGLSQMISMRYGTIPVVREVGGLADSVEEFNPATGEGTGFLFKEYSPVALLEAVKRALTIFGNKNAWKIVQINAMKKDFSWDASARKYVEVYKEAIQICNKEVK
ncbi:glycogen synthase GlgA [bacterium]|nr:glycogen synthase GlgA [bacterium]